ncbi:hypothetical protein [Hymenobacter ruricola]|uniref:Globin n=1 Tax=Hymenobacter ruricola TaxID=2791023 RepID=A0ABS0I3F2_9BACT|nr:hypothetical protein [Hymenobacter ruricola]MBF9221484.1 hypothetical protein [Hymenobacter ruricola]
MTTAEAYDLLLAHAGASPDPDHPKFAGGFLGMLRPYHALCEHNFHEVMQALRTVAPQLQEPAVDRELISALWGICHFGRAWALEKGSMLQRNDLITEADADRLDEWLSIISYAVTSLLDDSGAEEAFQSYDFYLANARGSGPAPN